MLYVEERKIKQNGSFACSVQGPVPKSHSPTDDHAAVFSLNILLCRSNCPAIIGESTHDRNKILSCVPSGASSFSSKPGQSVGNLSAYIFSVPATPFIISSCASSSAWRSCETRAELSLMTIREEMAAMSEGVEQCSRKM